MIILIGNGPSVLEFKIGHIIDSFKEVVRFNNFSINGYEKYVGTKTTIWSKNNTKGIKDFKCNNILTCGKPDEYDSINVEGVLIKNYHEIYNKWLSTGLMTILYLKDEGYKNIYLYGFDSFSKLKKHHYFSSSSKNKFHDGKWEFEFLELLEKQGVVIHVSANNIGLLKDNIKKLYL